MAWIGPRPMSVGSQPRSVDCPILASGFQLFWSRASWLHTMSMAAPSLIPDALPGVIEPSLSKAGFNFCRFWMVMPSLGCWSVGHCSRGAISFSNLFFCIASIALMWLLSAYWSCFSLEISNLSAIFCAVMPMCIFCEGSVSPSLRRESTRTASPSFRPVRMRLLRYGAFDIDSVPPQRMTFASPALIVWQAMRMACRPDAHMALMVYAGTFWLMFNLRAICLAMFMPRPAESTFPTMTVCILSIMLG